MINSKLGYSRYAAPRISHFPILFYGPGDVVLFCAHSLYVGGSVLINKFQCV